VLMRDRVMYVELKTGHDIDRGPGWISRVRLARAGGPSTSRGGPSAISGPLMRTTTTLRPARTSGSLVRTGISKTAGTANVPVEVDPDVADVYERFRGGGSLDLYGDETEPAGESASPWVPFQGGPWRSIKQLRAWNGRTEQCVRIEVLRAGAARLMALRLP
jgi:hypothetical protein